MDMDELMAKSYAGEVRPWLGSLAELNERAPEQIGVRAVAPLDKMRVF
jgi:hypothetical protein